ncbi:hypothetical protein AKI80_08050 [Streptococcus pneumoniae]|nr:hypothetical protein AKI80_08050 [Streptococcus pneumoniae]
MLFQSIINSEKYLSYLLECLPNEETLVNKEGGYFRNFENFKKRIFIALNIKKERTKFVLSQA